MPIEVSRNSELKTATITFSNPSKRNAMSVDMQHSLYDKLDELEDDDDIRAIILTGEGDIFTAGADIDEFLARADDPAAELDFANNSKRIYEKIETCSVPVIAKINGPAVGLGAEISLASDLRVAATTAKLIFGEINLAIVPPFERLARNVSDALLREICFTGRPLTAEEAEEADVFNRVVEPKNLDEATEALVSDITEISPHALAQTKEAMQYADGKSIYESIEYRFSLHYQCFNHPDFQESIEAFKEDREPEYQ